MHPGRLLLGFSGTGIGAGIIHACGFALFHRCAIARGLYFLARDDIVAIGIDLVELAREARHAQLSLTAGDRADTVFIGIIQSFLHAVVHQTAALCQLFAIGVSLTRIAVEHFAQTPAGFGGELFFEYLTVFYLVFIGRSGGIRGQIQRVRPR